MRPGSRSPGQRAGRDPAGRLTPEGREDQRPGARLEQRGAGDGLVRGDPAHQGGPELGVQDQREAVTGPRVTARGEHLGGRGPVGRLDQQREGDLAAGQDRPGVRDHRVRARMDLLVASRVAAGAARHRLPVRSVRCGAAGGGPEPDEFRLVGRDGRVAADEDADLLPRGGRQRVAVADDALGQRQGRGRAGLVRASGPVVRHPGLRRCRRGRSAPASGGRTRTAPPRPGR